MIKSYIRKIGNSKGIVIPPAFLAEFKLEKDSDVEIELRRDGILIKPAGNPRAGWEQRFLEAAGQLEETEGNYFEGISNAFDEEEWTW